MKSSALLIVAAATAVVPLSVPRAEKFLIYTSETEQQWVTEEEKWALRKQGVRFMDKTDSTSVQNIQKAAVYTYPTAVSHTANAAPLLEKLSEDSMKEHLATFTTFNNRYYKSDTGKKSSEWLLETVHSIIANSGATNASARAFPHPTWTQDSIIATVPGKSARTVVLGSHQDSVNWQAINPATARSPGADDNGSGSMVILEALTAYLQDETVQAGEAPNTVEFQWYAAEEEGLLGSQAIFTEYAKEGREVVGMLAQDMTGFVRKTLDSGSDPVVGVITDFVDEDLTAFLKVIVGAYCTIDYVETKCGYACSDHASASDAGYASAFVFESEFGLDSPYIHTANDTLASVDYAHMLQHARLSLGFAYELAFDDFN